MVMKIYCDNAATTRMSRSVIDTMSECLENTWGNPSSIYSLGQEAKNRIEDAREKIAGCIGASPKEIYFTSGGSEADNQALISAASVKTCGRKRIVSTEFEHHAILHTLESLEQQGIEKVLVGVGSDGIVDPADIEKAINEDTVLVSVMYANNEIGTIQPIREIGEICRRHNVLFHTDAVQAAGHIPVDIVKDNIDMLSISAHKFHGPKGTGILYCRKGTELRNLIYGGGQERGKRAGTENTAGIAGMAAALEDAVNNMGEKADHIRKMRDHLAAGLQKIPHSRINGSMSERLPGNVNISFEGIEGESLLVLLDSRGISASSGSACTSGSLDPSHVLTALGMPAELAKGSLRLTLGEYNTPDEIDIVISEVTGAVDYLRSMSVPWREAEQGIREHLI